jgi:small subunit ribosomal protein S22
MNQIYFPRDGKDFDVPKMFSSPEVLRQLLSRASEQDNTYEFVLDRACLQFEPDDPLFVDVCEAVYDEINEKRRFDFLKSTRHYGPFVFYLARTRKMDNLLLYSIEHDR